MLQVGVDGVGVAVFDSLALVHTNSSSARYLTTERSWEMKDVAHAVFVLQLLQQVEHLGLHRDVEGGDRFVADDDFRLHGGQRAMPIRWRWPPENSMQVF